MLSGMQTKVDRSHIQIELGLIIQGNTIPYIYSSIHPSTYVFRNIPVVDAQGIVVTTDSIRSTTIWDTSQAQRHLNTDGL